MPEDFPELSRWRACGTTGYYERIFPPSKYGGREFLHSVRDAFVVARVNPPGPQGAVAGSVELTGMDLAIVSPQPSVDAIFHAMPAHGLKDALEATALWIVERVKARERGVPLEALERTFESYPKEVRNKILSTSRWVLVDALEKGFIQDWDRLFFVYPFTGGMITKKAMKDAEDFYAKNFKGGDLIVSEDPTLKKPMDKYLKDKFGIVC